MRASYILKYLSKIHRRKVYMEKVKGSMETLSSMQLTKDMAGMDAESKELLRNKAVLAVILKGVVIDYK